MDKREHIINTAIDLFSEKGFEGTSIRDLASKADVNIAMINYYFGSKDKLFEAIVEHKSSFLRGKIDEVLHDASLSEIEKIEIIIEGYVDRILSQSAFHRVLHQELLMGQRESLHSVIVSVLGKNMQNVKSIIDQGIKKKVFNKVDPELTLASIIGTINHVTLSKSMCSILFSEGTYTSPYNNEAFKQRLLAHLKQLIKAYLIKN